MKRILLLAIALVYLIPFSAQAQFYVGPGAAGTAGAGRAAYSPLDGPHLNPASIAYLNKYYLGASYYGDSASNHERAWGVHVTDANPETMVAASASYIDKNRNIPNYQSVDEQDVQLTLAGMVYKGVAFGLSGHHLIQDPANADKQFSNNLNAGFLLSPTPNFGIGIVSYDLLGAKEEIPLVIRRQTTNAVALSYLLESVRFKADLVRQEKENPDRKMAYMVGVESYLMPQFSLRLGYQRDELADRRLYAGGFGFEGPKFSVDYALQIFDGEAGARHYVDLWAAF